MGPMENLAFKVTALWFGLRDRITPPKTVWGRKLPTCVPWAFRLLSSPMASSSGGKKFYSAD